MAERAACTPGKAWSCIAVSMILTALITWSTPLWVDKLGLQSTGAYLAIYYVAVFAPMSLLAVGFARLCGFRALRLGEPAGRWAAIGALTGLAGFAIAVAYSHFSGALIAGSAAGATPGMFMLGLLLILLQTGSEEVFFRGWLQTALLDRMPPVAAILGSSLIFTAFHLLGSVSSPVSLFNLLLGGIWFGLLAWRSGGLIAPVLAHFGWNAAEALVLGLTPNPGPGGFGTIFDLDLVGNAMWGAGEDGLNASIGMTIVLIALIVPLAWRPKLTAPVGPAPHPPGHVAG